MAAAAQGHMELAERESVQSSVMWHLGAVAREGQGGRADGLHSDLSTRGHVLPGRSSVPEIHTHPQHAHTRAHTLTHTYTPLAHTHKTYSHTCSICTYIHTHTRAHTYFHI